MSMHYNKTLPRLLDSCFQYGPLLAFSTFVVFSSIQAVTKFLKGKFVNGGIRTRTSGVGDELLGTLCHQLGTDSSY